MCEMTKDTFTRVQRESRFEKALSNLKYIGQFESNGVAIMDSEIEFKAILEILVTEFVKLNTKNTP